MESAPFDTHTTASIQRANQNNPNSCQGIKHVPDLSDELFKRDPARYYFLAAKKSEINLMFLDAAELYLAAHRHALAEKKSSAISFKWMSMRCIEFDAIYERLLKKQDPILKAGRALSDGSIMVSWTFDSMIIPKEILDGYKKRIPDKFYYNVLVWNQKECSMRFIQARDFYGASEPSIEKEYFVDRHGNAVEKITSMVDPEIILHKWMLSGKTLHGQQDRNAQIRRSIRIEYLKIPKCMDKGEFPRRVFWDNYIVPAIGNRNLGPLVKKYVASALG